MKIQNVKRIIKKDIRKIEKEFIVTKWNEPVIDSEAFANGSYKVLTKILGLLTEKKKGE